MRSKNRKVMMVSQPSTLSQRNYASSEAYVDITENKNVASGRYLISPGAVPSIISNTLDAQ
jgi:hypothetical protein